MTRRLILLACLLGVGSMSSACTPTDNCLVRGTCGEEVHIVRVEDNTDLYTTRGWAEVRGLDRWIEVPAADTLAACEDEENLDRSACG